MPGGVPANVIRVTRITEHEHGIRGAVDSEARELPPVAPPSTPGRRQTTPSASAGPQAPNAHLPGSCNGGPKRGDGCTPLAYPRWLKIEKEILKIKKKIENEIRGKLVRIPRKSRKNSRHTPVLKTSSRRARTLRRPPPRIPG
jgi:hypothetical protein